MVIRVTARRSRPGRLTPSRICLSMASMHLHPETLLEHIGRCWPHHSTHDPLTKSTYWNFAAEIRTMSVTAHTPEESSHGPPAPRRLQPPRRTVRTTPDRHAEFARVWQSANPDGTVTHRDVGYRSVPHVTEEWIAAAFTNLPERTPAMREALRLSDELIDELLGGRTPSWSGCSMYNFGLPSVLKAYVDQVVRIGRTFLFEPPTPLPHTSRSSQTKRVVVVSASGDGGFPPGGRYADWNHLHPHLRTVFEFIGITDVSVVHVENDEFGGRLVAESLAAASAEVARLTGQLIDSASPAPPG